MQATVATSTARAALRRMALPLVTVGALGVLVATVSPRAVADAMALFDVRVVLPLLVLSVGYYALQGFRWHLLLRNVGTSGRATDSMVVNLAGQATSAVLPLGDLTRGLLISRASGVPFSAAAATITVQELVFTVLVVAAATPGLARLPQGLPLVAVVLAGLAFAVAVLTVAPLWAVVHRLIASAPLLRRFAPGVDALQREVLTLLRRPAVLAGTVLDLGRVLVAVAALLLILRGLHIASLGWWDASLVLGLSFVGGALSLLPGGVGANEAGVTALLVVLGVNPAAAAAAALVQRLWLVAVPTVGGTLACLHVRRMLARPAAHVAVDQPVVLRGVPVATATVGTPGERLAA